MSEIELLNRLFYMTLALGVLFGCVLVSYLVDHFRGVSA